MKRALAIFFTFLIVLPILLMPLSNWGRLYYSDASPPIGSCPSSGPVTVNSSVYWANLACTLTGNLQVIGGGSLTLVNSTVFGANVIMRDNGAVSLLNSTIVLPSSASLTLLNDTRLSIIDSTLIIPTINVTNIAVLNATSSSYIKASNLYSSLLSGVFFFSSTLQSNFGIVDVEGSLFSAQNATLSFSNTTQIHLSAASTVIMNSDVTTNNVTALSIGSQSLAGSTAVGSSTVNDLNYYPGFKTAKSLNLYGPASLRIAGSSVNNLASSTSKIITELNLEGGVVNVSASTLVSSSKTYYGYLAASNSTLNLYATTNLNVAQSNLMVGQITSQASSGGLYRSANLTLSSNNDITVVRSQLNVVASITGINFNAVVPNNVQRIILNQTSVFAPMNPGFVYLTSSYELFLSQTSINAQNSTFLLNSYRLTAYDSNLSATVVFGITRSSALLVGYLYNFTATKLAAIGIGAFYRYGWLNTHVLSSQSSQGLANAQISVIDPTTGVLTNTATANTTGWAKIPVLVEVQNASLPNPLKKTNYIVAASLSGLNSQQINVNTGSNFYVTLNIEASPSISNLNSSTISTGVLTGTYNMLGYTFSVVPPGYAYGQYIPYVTIFSNAAPIPPLGTNCNYACNNFSKSALSFLTRGNVGYNFSFVVIYPKNFSQTPISVSVDGFQLGSKTYSNSTYYFSVFTLPSGAHSFLLYYIPPVSYYQTPPLPYLYPGFRVIIAVVLIAVLGIGFIALYIRRHGRGYNPVGS